MNSDKPAWIEALLQFSTCTSLNFISIVSRIKHLWTYCYLLVTYSWYFPKKILVGIRNKVAPCCTCASGSDVPWPSRVVKQRSKSRPSRFTTVPWDPVALGPLGSEGPTRVMVQSMYGLYTNIGDILMVNVTIFSIHGSYGICIIIVS
jgi:hypothetical protein